MILGSPHQLQGKTVFWTLFFGPKSQALFLNSCHVLIATKLSVEMCFSDFSEIKAILLKRYTEKP